MGLHGDWLGGRVKYRSKVKSQLRELKEKGKKKIIAEKGEKARGEERRSSRPCKNSIIT